MFRLGRVCPPKGPGIVLVLPLIDQWQKVDLRTRAFNIPPCQVKQNLLKSLNTETLDCRGHKKLSCISERKLGLMKRRGCSFTLKTHIVGQSFLPLGKLCTNVQLNVD